MARGIAVGTALLLMGCAATPTPMMLPAGTVIADGGDALPLARSKFEQGEYGLAIDLFRAQLRRDPASPAAWAGLAMAYDRLGRTDLSEGYRRKAFALGASDATVPTAYRASAHDQASPSAPVIDPAASSRSATADCPTSGDIGDAPGSGPRLVRVSAAEVRIETNGGSLAADRVAAALQPRTTPLLPARRMARVVNAVGRRGLAFRIGRRLGLVDQPAQRFGNSRYRLAISRMVYPPSERGQAEVLSRRIPFRLVMQQTAAADRLTLFVGRNAVPWERRSWGAP